MPSSQVNKKLEKFKKVVTQKGDLVYVAGSGGGVLLGTHLLTLTHSYSLTPTHSLLLTYSLPPSLTYSLTHLLTHSLVDKEKNLFSVPVEKSKLKLMRSETREKSEFYAMASHGAMRLNISLESGDEVREVRQGGRVRVVDDPTCAGAIYTINLL